jgi:cyanophycinase
VLPIPSRTEAADQRLVELLDEVDGVFLTGGNQLRLSTMIGGTPVAKALRIRNAEGLHIAGTSAGAAFLCEHMIAFGKEGASPRAKIVTMAPGLGLTNRIIIDQHFRQRDRLGRLLTALAYNPFAIGIGLDENTAGFIAPDETLEVVGSGALTIVDASELEFSSMARVRKNDPVCLIGLRLHVLDHGSTFNLHTREAAAAPEIARRP